MTYLKINNLQEVDLQLILNDYITNFTQRYLVVTTNYNKIREFEIRFNKTDIHHLLGLHKVQDSNVNATRSLALILEGRLTVQQIRKHHRFYEIKSRLVNYNFLHKCFIDCSIALCVIPSSGRNPQKLDIVFQDKHKHSSMLVGLRKAKGQDYYVIATMYEINSKNIYGAQKRTKVTSMTWHDYC